MLDVTNRSPDPDVGEASAHGDLGPMAATAGAVVVAGVAAIAFDAVAAALAFLAAIIVAAMTWVGTERRQREALAADAAKQERQLAHDRALTDVADIRALLDEAAVSLHIAFYALMNAQAALTSFGTKLHTTAPEAGEAVTDAGTTLDSVAARLAVRLGRDHAVAAAFIRADEALLEVNRALGLVFGDEAGSPQGAEEMKKVRDRIRDAAKSFGESRAAFEAAAIAYVGTRLD
ncbi:hypothetical protein GKE82_25010 [Conexibacter sp. W3-3-2]|uniref:hypothetical protein n=1 Tax=Conexibacter sp. W3-3-2 TaxID=2675227 RepID=UPI0012B79EF9|nr:hypothetical protein [Conexibacter sp. W3-3-2]MTD47466.1 hypothetical protein [Conexibacter sp. W3-3-2]